MAMNIRSVARAGAWVVGGLLVLAVSLYVLLVAVNWRDEAPSRDAVAFDRLLDERAPVADEANAFVFVLGMAAPPGADPLALGRERKAYLETFDAAAHPTAAFPGIDDDYRARRPGAIAQLAGACSKGTPECARLLRATPDDVDAWLASESWLLDRYEGLISRRAWREAVPDDLRAPMPSYQHALEGQKLYLVQAWRAARSGDAERARGMVDADMRFWRTVLASSDLLISKMVAAAGVRRNLTLGSLVLRELPTGQAGGLPSSWLEPLSVRERSARRALAGEWRFSSRVVASTGAPGAPADLAAHEYGAPARLTRPLYQPQATSNLFASALTRLAEVSELPYPAIGPGFRAFAKEHDSAGPGLYNPVGRVLVSIGGGTAYWNYVARLADLEALRSAAVLAGTVRARNGHGQAAGAARMALDPYGHPFDWDAAKGVFTFRSLERGEADERSIVL